MAARGYLIFLVRVAIPNRPVAMMHLDAIEKDEELFDLLDVVEANLVGLGNSYYSDDKSADGYRLRSLVRSGRGLWIRINKGPEGSSGEAYDRETGRSTETGEQVSLLSGLRAKFYVPADSYYGLLFVEKSGLRNLKDLLYRLAVRPAALETRSGVRLESFAEAEDWRRELADQHAFRISEVLKSPNDLQDPSEANDTIVKITTEGTRVRRIGDSIKAIVLHRVAAQEKKLKLLTRLAPLEAKRLVDDQRKERTAGGRFPTKKAPRSIFTVQDEAEYKDLLEDLNAIESGDLGADLIEALESVSPAERANLERVRFEVAMGQARAERTFVVEGDSLPQFVYEFGAQLSDLTMESTWDQHALQILTDLDCPPSSGWLVPATQ